MQVVPGGVNDQPSTAELEAQQAALKAQENPGVLRNLIKFGEEDLLKETDPVKKAVIENTLRANLQKLISRQDNPAELAANKKRLGALLDSKYIGTKDNGGIAFEEVNVADVIKNKNEGAFDFLPERNRGSDSFEKTGGAGLQRMGDGSRVNWDGQPDIIPRPERTKNPDDSVGRINL